MGGNAMDISAEVATIQAASRGSELRQPLVGALNKLNSGSLPAVTTSDVGKILKVGANGWEVGEKSGYMPVPTATKHITDNGTYDVTNYASANVHISSGGSAVLVPKTITQNGTYDPANDNADGYSEVDVNVASPIELLKGSDIDTIASLNPQHYSIYSGVSISNVYINSTQMLSGGKAVSLRIDNNSESAMVFSRKFLDNEFTEIEIEMKVSPQSTPNSYDGFVLSFITSFETAGSTQFDVVRFYSASRTIEEITSQSRIKAISVNNDKSISAQIVKIDLSNMGNDYYIRLYNMGAYSYIRNIKLIP